MYRCHSALISHPFGISFFFCPVVSTPGPVSNSYLIFCLYDINMMGS